MIVSVTLHFVLRHIDKEIIQNNPKNPLMKTNTLFSIIITIIMTAICHNTYAQGKDRDIIYTNITTTDIHVIKECTAVNQKTKEPVLRKIYTYDKKGKLVAANHYKVDQATNLLLAESTK